MPTSRQAIIPKYLCLILAVLVALEGLAWLAAIPLRGVGMFYDPGQITQSFDAYISRRDPMLGWAPQMGMPGIDAEGARAIPTDMRSDPICVSLFGDSFTWALTVGDGETWGVLLAQRLGCGVANFGVIGYGSDQAYLRYLERPKTGGIVFLNHFSKSILNNVSQFRNLIYPGPELALKPRFVESGDGPVLIPVPKIPADGLNAFLTDPSTVLTHEYFLPGTADGLTEAKFPYLWSVLHAVVRSRQFEAVLTGLPTYAALYAPDHPSHALAVTERIFDEFAAAARANGQIPVVTIIPTCRELRHAQETGVWTYAPLAAHARDEAYPVLDVGPELLRRLGDAPPDDIYERVHGPCSEHFNATGYEYLAEIAYAFLWKHEATRKYLSEIGLAEK
ncbi:MAG: hypothetical protein AB7M05_02590 [Alphaproteobacteria bacterium]